MRLPDPDWESLVSQPFGRWIPEDVLKYRANEVRALQRLRESEPFADGTEIEVGCNRGRFLRGLCLARPDTPFVGIELKGSLVRIANRRLVRHGATNGRALQADARLFLAVCVNPGSIGAIYVLFPDPWWKKRHAKRRLVDEHFLSLAHHVLANGGHLVLKTDVPTYARRVQRSVRKHGGFELVDAAAVPGQDSWDLTTRERHCAEEGTRITGVFARKA